MAAKRLEDLVAEHGLSGRAIRAWVAEGVLPKPVPRGRATAYDDDFQQRLSAAVKLRKQGVGLAAIRRKLASMTRDELLAFVSPPAARAEGPVVVPVANAWERVELLPGLELHVKLGAGPLLERLRDEIKARYGVSAGPSGE